MQTNAQPPKAKNSRNNSKKDARRADHCYRPNIGKFIWLVSLMILAMATDMVLSAPTLSCTNATEPEFNRSLLNSTSNYPITPPILNPDGSIKYRIGIISDLDEASKSPTEPYTWISYYKRGYLTYSQQNMNVSIEWDNDTTVFKSHYSIKGRGLELSELISYNGELITVGDKTGLIQIINGKKLMLWLLAVAGDGRQDKGMKFEWITVKDSKLYGGSHGRETLASDGVTVIDRSLMWVVEIDKNGAIKHLDWEQNFVKLRNAVCVKLPGYMIHESCVWSDVHGRWFFLPRKISYEKYDEHSDSQKGTNVLLAATPDFEDIKVTRIGNIIPDHGYSSFKFIPETNDTVITAISTVEEENTTATFISVFTVEGDIIYPQTKVIDKKFEGIEFI